MTKNYSQLLSLITLTLASTLSFAGPLITPTEAKLPDANGSFKTRGISRGPAIKVSSPDIAAPEVKSPFDLKVLFESRGGNKIDPAAVKVSYIKASEIDLTSRLKGSITEGGIDFAKAEVPPGEHNIKITVKDVDGRESSTILTLNIAK